MTLAPGVYDGNLRSWSLWSCSDADHVRVSDGHHAEGDVSGGGVVSAPNFVDLVRPGGNVVKTFFPCH